MASISSEIINYNNALTANYLEIANTLADQINSNLAESENKLWHGHPVWSLNGNPVAGYSMRKGGICLLFWSGQSFEESGLKSEGSFKAAQIFYNSASEINEGDLTRWLDKATKIQWDYKNIVKKKGVLERL